MKKLFMLALPLVVFSSVSSAITSCTSQATWTSLQLNGLGAAGCEIGDKVYYNWSGSFSNTADTMAFTGPTAPVGPGLAFYQLNLNAGVNSTLQGNFTFGYQVSIDQSMVTNGYSSTVTNLSAGIQDNAHDGATLVKTVSGGPVCGTASSTDVAGNVSKIDCPMNNNSFTVSEAFSYVAANDTNPGGAHSISGIGNTITESFTNTTGAPEPMSMFLFGGGLLGLSLIGRRKLVRK